MSLALTSISFAEECKIGDRVVGFQDGKPNISWDALVSKNPSQKLSPLAAPTPLRILPVEFLSPENQSYYKKVGSQEYMLEEAALSLLQMISKARSEGIEIYVYSSYRSYQTQCAVFKSKVQIYMKASGADLETAIQFVNTKSAFPGESEHQLGTAVDLVTNIPKIGYKLEFEFSKTPAYQWLQERAHEYGFVLSFPLAQGISQKEPHPRTGIIFEPWHWRYFGNQHARIYRDCREKMTIQEFLRKLRVESTFQCLKTVN